MTAMPSLLCALTCETMPAHPLMVSRPDDGGPKQISAPLGNKVSIPLLQAELRDQIATLLQLIAAVQVVRYPWMTMDGLYRVIVTPDRHATLLANEHLLEAIGQSVAMHVNKKSAFAFPCPHGIVVVLPLDVIRLALAPDTEVERQYGLTTVWHELAHVHALSKQYFANRRLQIPVDSRICPTTIQAWHEFFAERHSHWPGFDTALERHLVDEAWKEFVSEPTRPKAAHLLVRLASAHGRVPTHGDLGTCISAFPQVFASNSLIKQWHACAEALEQACVTIVESGNAPDLVLLNQRLGNLADGLMVPHL
ncbi:hypothetical protein [Aquabacterium sp.]|uniref:hypothetical protein n=1 Tax=Aquabacterium sp. TaxID=1872578 RepID=UPI004037A6BD